MSHYLTPEQRQIRDLRSQISSLNNQNRRQTAQNRKLQDDLNEVRRQRKRENEEMARKFQQQSTAHQRERAAMSEQLTELDRQIQEKERLQNMKIQSMQQQHEQDLDKLQQQFESDQRTMQQQIQQTRTDMTQQMETLREQTAHKIAEQEHQTQSKISQLNRQFDSKIRSLDQKVDSLARQVSAREEGSRELALYWALEAERLMRQLKETYREQLFSPRETAAIRRGIQQANDDIQSGQYQSSITAGRNAFYDALDMREDLAAAEFEWNYWYNAVRTREEQLLNDLDAAENRVYEYPDPLDGETIEEDSGIDYWTYGQLKIVSEHITAGIARLQSAEKWTTEQLKESEKQLSALQEELLQVENAAHTNIAMMLSRIETCKKIGEILGENFQMEDCEGDFFNEENNEEYHAIFTNPVTNDQVAVVITPIPDQAGFVTNHIELIPGNSDNSPITKDRIAKAVAKKLRAGGIDNCSFPCAQRYGDDTRKEVARVGDIAAVSAGEERVRGQEPAQTNQNTAQLPRIIRTTRTSDSPGGEF